MRLARIAAATLLLSVASCATLQAEFAVEAVLRDGRTLNGRFSDETIPLTLVVHGGETVEMELRRPASWSSLSTAAEVEWLPERSLFRIRAASFTAEALAIRSPLEFRERAGRAVELPWDEVQRVRFVAQ